MPEFLRPEHAHASVLSRALRLSMLNAGLQPMHRLQMPSSRQQPNVGFGSGFCKGYEPEEILEQASRVQRARLCRASMDDLTRPPAD